MVKYKDRGRFNSGSQFKGNCQHTFPSSVRYLPSGYSLYTRPYEDLNQNLFWLYLSFYFLNGYLSQLNAYNLFIVGWHREYHSCFSIRYKEGNLKNIFERRNWRNKECEIPLKNGCWKISKMRLYTYYKFWLVWVCKRVSELIKIFFFGNAEINHAYTTSIHCVCLYSLCACAHIK